MKIEAVFGGLLALVVVVIAVLALLSVRFGYNDPPSDDVSILPVGASSGALGASTSLCECFEEGRRVADTNVGVMSSQYRTGFEYCRAALGPRGGDAWTAGWKARGGAAYQASCRRWLGGSI
jgi:hypothetical protein